LCITDIDQDAAEVFGVDSGDRVRRRRDAPSKVLDVDVALEMAAAPKPPVPPFDDSSATANELEIKNPKDEHGYRKAKHHQFFTDDIGHPALAQHLHAVVGLMRAADTWDQFQAMINRAFPRRGDTLQLPLFADDEFPMN
jgi:hypothetical protein